MLSADYAARCVRICCGRFEFYQNSGSRVSAASHHVSTTHQQPTTNGAPPVCVMNQTMREVLSAADDASQARDVPPQHSMAGWRREAGMVWGAKHRTN
jgi:hypothetical protein